MATNKKRKNKIISIDKAILMAGNKTIWDIKKSLNMSDKTLSPQKMLERAAKTNNLLVSIYIRLNKEHHMWNRESCPYLNNFIFSGALSKEDYYKWDSITENSEIVLL